MMIGFCKLEKFNKMNMLVIFFIFDNNKDGFVDVIDFQKIMNSMGQFFGEFEFKFIIGEMDKKCQGKLDYKGNINFCYLIKVL